eukprot:COSAG06_NODE_33504_length_489_cov_0.430769_1_plen_24_part_10
MDAETCVATGIVAGTADLDMIATC